MSVGIMPSRCRICGTYSRNLASQAHAPSFRAATWSFDAMRERASIWRECWRWRPRSDWVFARDFLIRSGEEWRKVVARNPFRKEAERDSGHLVVMFLKSAASEKDVKAVQAAITGPEIVRGDGRHLYIVYPDGIGRSRLTNALLEKKLGIRGTARNWNTVLKLAAFADDEIE